MNILIPLDYQKKIATSLTHLAMTAKQFHFLICHCKRSAAISFSLRINPVQQSRILDTCVTIYYLDAFDHLNMYLLYCKHKRLTQIPVRKVVIASLRPVGQSAAIFPFFLSLAPEIATSVEATSSQ